MKEFPTSHLGSSDRRMGCEDRSDGDGPSEGIGEKQND